jgi:hypothetical protein
MTSNNKNENEEEVKFYTADLVTPAPGSEDARPCIIPGSEKPIDIESLPIEHQAIARILARAVEKAEESGEADGARITLTREQFDSELKKLRKEKRKSKR